MSTKRPTATEQFEKLGIDPADWTEVMQLAVKQRWTGLPVDKTVAELRAAAAAVEVPKTPTATELLNAGTVLSTGKSPEVALEDAKAEAQRLARNAKVNAWRERKQILAALDARELRFAAMRAKRTETPAKTKAAKKAAAELVNA